MFYLTNRNKYNLIIWLKIFLIYSSYCCGINIIICFNYLLKDDFICENNQTLNNANDIGYFVECLSLTDADKKLVSYILVYKLFQYLIY